MQAASNRLPGPSAHRRRTNPSAQPHLMTADDAALLGALPIAAAVIMQNEDGTIRVLAHNSRFSETIDQSTCSALEWAKADCLKAGPISELLANYFAGTDTVGELDFRNGEGVAAHYFRIKLAPLPRVAQAVVPLRRYSGS